MQKSLLDVIRSINLVFGDNTNQRFNECQFRYDLFRKSLFIKKSSKILDYASKLGAKTFRVLPNAGIFSTTAL